MNKLIAALILICSLTSAIAAPPLYPPKQYDKPYDKLQTFVLPLAEIQEHCEYVGYGHGRLACAILYTDGLCEIFLPALGEHGIYASLVPVTINEDLFEGLYRHEQGHCNGWPADHRM